MAAQKFTVNSAVSLTNVIDELRKAFVETRYFQVTFETGKKRTVSQNSIGHAWYAKVSKDEGEYSPGGIKQLCKFHFGLPILRGADAHYNDKCAEILDSLTYEQKIAAMEYWPVTSLMNTKQKAEYLKSIQINYLGRVDLRFPGEER